MKLLRIIKETSYSIRKKYTMKFRLLYQSKRDISQKSCFMGKSLPVYTIEWAYWTRTSNLLILRVFVYEDVWPPFWWATKKADFIEEISLFDLWLPELDSSGHWSEGFEV